MTMMDNSVDSVVASSCSSSSDVWQRCLRALKPGGHAVVLAEPTAYHRVAVAIEDAGFEIRDQIIWLHDRHNSIVLARKPLVGTVANNVLTYGVGGLNIDDTRVPSDDGFEKAWDRPISTNISAKGGKFISEGIQHTVDLSGNKPKGGRWPANVITDGSAGVVAGFPDSNGGAFPQKSNVPTGRHYEGGWGAVDNGVRTEMGSGSAVRFFATAPTQISLFRYLIKLVTPPNGVVLDPFDDSTIAAAIEAEGMTRARNK